MGLGSERHDIHSYETHDAQWLGFRQPVLRGAREREGINVSDTREVNPGEVWEENEFWLSLTWRIDPDGSLGIRQYAESKKNPGEKLGIDEYYEWIFENSLPGLPQKAAEENRTPLEFMRRYGVYEVNRKTGALYEETVPAAELDDLAEDEAGRVFTRVAKPLSPNIVPLPTPDGDQDGRRLVGINQGGEIKRGFPRRAAALNSFRAPWSIGAGLNMLCPYIKSHVHRDHLAEDQTILISTFRLATQIHTRSQREVARRNRAHQPALDSYIIRRAARYSHR